MNPWYSIKQHSSDKNNTYTGWLVLNETREVIADYLGVARPALSRELGRMQFQVRIKIQPQNL